MKRIFRKTFLIASVFVLTISFVFLDIKPTLADAAQDLAACELASQTKITNLETQLRDAQTLHNGMMQNPDPTNPPTPEDEALALSVVNDIQNELTQEAATLQACSQASQNFVAPNSTPPATTTPANTQTTASTPLFNPLGTVSIESFIGRSIRIVLSMAGIAAFLMFIWGGILWMTSAGNADRIQKGKDTLIWATIGLVVLFSAYAIVEVLVTVLSTGGI